MRRTDGRRSRGPQRPLRLSPLRMTLLHWLPAAARRPPMTLTLPATSGCRGDSSRGVGVSQQWRHSCDSSVLFGDEDGSG